jgi:hypothetical protein
MRRRYDDDPMRPPAELLVFSGRQYGTDEGWRAAFAEWHEARARWLSVRGLPEDGLPAAVVDGDCPFDYRSI